MTNKEKKKENRKINNQNLYQDSQRQIDIQKTAGKSPILHNYNHLLSVGVKDWAKIKTNICFFTRFFVQSCIVEFQNNGYTRGRE